MVITKPIMITHTQTRTRCKSQAGLWFTSLSVVMTVAFLLCLHFFNAHSVTRWWRDHFRRTRSAAANVADKTHDVWAGALSCRNRWLNPLTSLSLLLLYFFPSSFLKHIFILLSHGKACDSDDSFTSDTCFERQQHIWHGHVQRQAVACRSTVHRV